MSEQSSLRFNQQDGRPQIHPSEQLRDKVAALIGSLGKPTFPDDRSYHGGHLWVKPLSDSVHAIGIDHLAAAMLGSVAGVVLPPSQTRIIHRMPWCWLIHHDGAVSLPAPVHATVLESNQMLPDHPEYLVQDPYESGWLARVHIDKGASDQMSSSQYHQRVERELLALQTRVLHSLKKAPPIGQTLHDGGQSSTSLAALLGTKSFFEILTSLFSP